MQPIAQPIENGKITFFLANFKKKCQLGFANRNIFIIFAPEF